jgi:chromosome partitioning protein
MVRKLAVSVVKGGAGKTTTAVAVATELSGKGKRVLLVDLDPQGHVAKALGIRNKVYDKQDNPAGACLSFLLDGTRPLDQCVVTGSQSELKDGRWVITGSTRPNLYVIPATDRLKSIGRRLYGADNADSTPPDDPAHFSNALNLRLGPVASKFDYIILDCPPNLDLFAPAVYRFVDEVIMPVQPSDLDLDGLVQQVRELQGDQERGRYKYRARLSMVVPTRTRMNQTLDQDIVATLRETFQGMVSTPVPELIAVKRAAAYGRVIGEFEATSPAAVAYREVARQVARG